MTHLEHIQAIKFPQPSEESLYVEPIGPRRYHWAAQSIKPCEKCNSFLVILSAQRICAFCGKEKGRTA